MSKWYENQCGNNYTIYHIPINRLSLFTGSSKSPKKFMPLKFIESVYTWSLRKLSRCRLNFYLLLLLQNWILFSHKADDYITFHPEKLIAQSVRYIRKKSKRKQNQHEWGDGGSAKKCFDRLKLNCDGRCVDRWHMR